MIVYVLRTFLISYLVRINVLHSSSSNSNSGIAYCPESKAKFVS